MNECLSLQSGNADTLYVAAYLRGINHIRSFISSGHVSFTQDACYILSAVQITHMQNYLFEKRKKNLLVLLRKFIDQLSRDHYFGIHT